MMKQRIVGSQSMISSMFNRFYNSTNVHHKLLWDCTFDGTWLATDTLLALHYDIRLSTIAEFYRTYATVYIGYMLLFALILYAHKARPCLGSLLGWGSMGFESIYQLHWHLEFCVVPAYLFGLCYDHVFAFDYLGWIGMISWETSQYLYYIMVTLGMPWPSIGKLPLVEGFLLLVWLLAWFGSLIWAFWFRGL